MGSGDLGCRWTAHGGLKPLILPTRAGEGVVGGTLVSFLLVSLVIGFGITASKAISEFDRRDVFTFGVTVLTWGGALAAVWILSEGELLRPAGSQLAVVVAVVGLVLAPVVSVKATGEYFSSRRFE
ncbi:hypothetical protein [Salinigranum sp. GCM10025319]|uniref:hypothetical protein n=1 Tax=Salinigranum sp. GCM10025319 TaxID=3252687 RepID=UPI00361744FC